MRAFLIGLAVLVILALAAVFIGPSLIPASVYKDQISQAVAKATGRPFTIKGNVGLSIFPSVKAHIERASLGNVPGGKAPSMAEIGRLDVGLALFPLLSHRVEMKSFVLNDAVIHLETDKNGKGNWEFETAQTQNAATPNSSNANALSELRLGDVRLINGLVTFDNLKTGEAHSVEKINAKIGLPSLDQPMQIAGDAVYKGKKLDFTVDADKPRAFIEHGDTPLKLEVKSDPLSLSFGGNATIADKSAFAGSTKLTVPSVRSLAAWLGNPMPEGKGFGPLTVEGNANYTGDEFAFDNADLNFDSIHATGRIKADLAGKKPAISGSLSTDNLDLRPYIVESKAAADGKGAPSVAATQWSTEKIDASALKSFDANLSFLADKILVRDLTIGKSMVALTVRNGVMTADLQQMALYDGTGKGVVTLDASASHLALASKLALSGINLEHFMHDFAKSDKLEGSGNFNIDVHSSGNSQRDLVSNLAGNSVLDFKNGAVKGVDLVKIAQAVNALTGKNKQTNQAQTQTDANAAAEQAQGSDEKTKFVAMGGTFAIASGVMTTSDLKMLNDLISLSGSGSINLVQQTIDMRVDPGRSQNDGGLKVALLIKGPLAKPKITPDMSALIKNEINKALDKFLGGGKKPTDSNGQPTTENGKTSTKDTAKELLKGLFGGQ